jgi:hypothetical protein
MFVSAHSGLGVVTASIPSRPLPSNAAPLGHEPNVAVTRCASAHREVGRAGIPPRSSTCWPERSSSGWLASRRVRFGMTYGGPAKCIRAISSGTLHTACSHAHMRQCTRSDVRTSACLHVRACVAQHAFTSSVLRSMITAVRLAHVQTGVCLGFWAHTFARPVFETQPAGSPSQRRPPKLPPNWGLSCPRHVG